MASTVFGGPEPLFLLLLALAVDAAAGERLGAVVPDPARVAFRVAEDLDRRLNRPQRSPRDRLIRGLLVMLALLTTAALAGFGAGLLTATLPGGWLLELALLTVSLRGGACRSRVRGVRRALESGSTLAAQEAVLPLTRRHAYGLDEYGVARAAVEHAARTFDRKWVAPAFWYVLLGLPGLFAWNVVDGAAAALGQGGSRQAWFGLTAARLDDALNALPARLAALLLAAASLFLGGASLPRAARTLLADARRGGSLNDGWPLAATAGALDLALAGPYRDGGVLVDAPWIGAGRARVTPADLDRALALAGVAGLLLALLIGLLVIGVASL